MNAFEKNKHNSVKFIEVVLSGTTIVSYGFITAVDYDSVVVTPAVSDRPTAEKIRCTFMNLGDDLFALIRKPVIGMRVMVFSPSKASDGMYESYSQVKQNEGRDFILTCSPAIYSSQFAFCIPAMKSTSQALSSIVIDSDIISAEIKHEIIALLDKTVELDLKADSNIEYHEGTKHVRGFYGDLEETFGMVQGIGGTEKPGTYVYKETYGKFSSVEKNYESGAVINVGKTFEKPFLENKGAAVDSSAPVTINMGANAPVTLSFGAPVSVAFGENVVTLTADAENGLDIALTGAMKVSITAETGKFSISNSTGSLKDVLDQIVDLVSGLTTIGPNVVPGAPYTAAAAPATVALATQLKTLVSGLLE